jgi:hypothetical protein
MVHETIGNTTINEIITPKSSFAVGVVISEVTLMIRAPGGNLWEVTS